MQAEEEENARDRARAVASRPDEAHACCVREDDGDGDEQDDAQSHMLCAFHETTCRVMVPNTQE